MNRTDNEPASRLRVVIVDDEAPIRELLSRSLDASGDVEVVGVAADGEEALVVTVDTKPDVVLLDLVLGPSQRGTDIIPSLLVTSPSSMIAIMTGMPAEQEEAGSLQAGAFVYYEKNMLPRLVELMREDMVLFRRALRGERVVAPSCVDRGRGLGQRVRA